MPSQTSPKISYDIAVIGSGVAGLGAAAAFAKRGFRVAVISRKGVGGEATPRAAGILDPLLEQNQKSPLIPAAIEAFRLFPGFLKELKRCTGSDADYKRTGMLYLAVNESEKKELQKRFAWQKKWMPSLEWLEHSRILKRFPEASPEAICGLFYPEVGKIHAPKFLRDYRRYVRGLGVKFYDSRTYPRIVRLRNGGFVIKSSKGVLAAAKVINAAGAWSPDKRLLGKKLPVSPVRGQMLILKGKKNLSTIFHCLTGGYLVPRGKGVHLAGSTVEFAGFRGTVTSKGRKDILKKVRSVCPETARMKVVGSWAGLRPYSHDKMPVMGEVPGQANYYAATGYFRSGILLGAFLGDQLAEAILTGRSAPLLQPFDARRFAKA